MRGIAQVLCKGQSFVGLPDVGNVLDLILTCSGVVELKPNLLTFLSETIDKLRWDDSIDLPLPKVRSAMRRGLVC